MDSFACQELGRLAMTIVWSEPHLDLKLKPITLLVIKTIPTYKWCAVTWAKNTLRVDEFNNLAVLYRIETPFASENKLTNGPILNPGRIMRWNKSSWYTWI